MRPSQFLLLYKDIKTEYQNAAVSIYSCLIWVVIIQQSYQSDLHITERSLDDLPPSYYPEV